MSSRGVSIDFNWNDYLTLAKELYEGSNRNPALSEAMLRSSISRAYFAVFCLARNYLKDVENKIIPTQDTHNWVITQFNVPEERTKLKIHQQLIRLKRDRIKADYDNAINGLNNIAESVLIGVKSTIDNIDLL